MTASAEADHERQVEEREFLLRSIADLDREYEVGDIDETDYVELRRGYVTRAATAIRALESGAESGTESSTSEVDPETPRDRRPLLWIGGSLVFALIAGVMLANALGARGSAQITGAGALPNDARNQCQSLSFQEPEAGIECYATYLEDQPDDPDALTYQGWAMVRSGDIEGGSAVFERVREIDPTFADVYVFQASVAKNAGNFVEAQAALDALYALNPSRAVLGTMESMGLEAEVAEGVLAADVSACWTEESTALGAVDSATGVPADQLDKALVNQAFASLAVAGKCFDDILNTRPDDLDSLRFSSLAVGLLSVVDPSFLATAEAQATRVLELKPNDGTALLLRSVWKLRVGDFNGATGDLDALGDGRVSPLIAPYIDRSQVRSEIASAVRDLETSTTTSP